MSVSSFFKAAGKALDNAYYWATGAKALEKKDLVHEANDSVFALNCIGSIALGISGGIVVGLAAPIAVPLAVAFGAAAAFTGASLPPRLQSTYVIAKDKHQKKKAAKAAKRSPPVSK